MSANNDSICWPMMRSKKTEFGNDRVLFETGICLQHGFPLRSLCGHWQAEQRCEDLTHIRIDLRSDLRGLIEDPPRVVPDYPGDTPRNPGRPLPRWKVPWCIFFAQCGALSKKVVSTLIVIFG